MAALQKDIERMTAKCNSAGDQVRGHYLGVPTLGPTLVPVLPMTSNGS